MSPLQRPTVEYLYKYGSLENPDRLKQILVDNEIYFPTSSQLNDPTECLPLIEAHSIDNILDFFCEQYIVTNPTATPEEIDHVRRQGLLYGEEVLTNICRGMLHTIFQDRYGILSLTQKGDSGPLWAHYGNNNKGYCIEFHNSGNIACGYEVLYQERLPLVLSSHMDPSSVEFFFTKHPDWSYEEEVRIIDSPGVKPLDPSLIRSVRLGENVSEAQIEQVKELLELRSSSVILEKAHINPATLEINYISLT